PVSVRVDRNVTAAQTHAAQGELILREFDLRPAKIIERLGLRRPIYAQTAAYGHFGRTDVDLPWERLDAVESLRGSLSAR
ncbi:MAG: methionine adenosyltransferase domain-containing protein, partial [Oscillospiraceae bacterium]|nr:methionine adenosyltransferase domain-containing protein [Oscillospiraceae bacterium]